MTRTRVSLEATELNEAGDDWTEAGAFFDRDDEPDPELREQLIMMTPAEMRALYERLTLYYEQGIWSSGTVDREA